MYDTIPHPSCRGVSAIFQPLRTVGSRRNVGREEEEKLFLQYWQREASFPLKGMRKESGMARFLDGWGTGGMPT
jgi:hypothetical protein